MPPKNPLWDFYRPLAPQVVNRQRQNTGWNSCVHVLLVIWHFILYMLLLSWHIVVFLLAGQTARQEATVANRQNLATDWSRSVCWWFIHKPLGTISHPGTSATESTSGWCERRACRRRPDCLLHLYGVRRRLVWYQLSLLLLCHCHCHSLLSRLFLSVLWSWDRGLVVLVLLSR